MKILVIGKNGQLGKSIKKVLANSEQHNEYIFVGRDCIDLTKKIVLMTILKIIFSI